MCGLLSKTIQVSVLMAKSPDPNPKSSVKPGISTCTPVFSGPTHRVSSFLSSTSLKVPQGKVTLNMGTHRFRKLHRMRFPKEIDVNVGWHDWNEILSCAGELVFQQWLIREIHSLFNAEPFPFRLLPCLILSIARLPPLHTTRIEAIVVISNQLFLAVATLQYLESAGLCGDVGSV